MASFVTTALTVFCVLVGSATPLVAQNSSATNIARRGDIYVTGLDLALEIEQNMVAYGAAAADETLAQTLASVIADRKFLAEQAVREQLDQDPLYLARLDHVREVLLAEIYTNMYLDEKLGPEDMAALEQDIIDQHYGQASFEFTEFSSSHASLPDVPSARCNEIGDVVEIAHWNQSWAELAPELRAKIIGIVDSNECLVYNDAIGHERIVEIEAASVEVLPGEMFSREARARIAAQLITEHLDDLADGRPFEMVQHQSP